MKNIFAIFCAFMALSGYSAWIVDGVDVEKPVGRITKDLPQEKKEAMVHAKTVRHKLKTGGTLRDIKSQKGKIIFLNAQKKVTFESISKRAETMSEFFKVAVSAKNTEKKISLAAADSVYESEKAEACIFIVDDSSIPVPLINAPERKWAFLNVAALAADTPSALTLKLRTLKEMWRAAGYMMAFNTPAPACVFKGAYSLTDLDKLADMPATTALPSLWSNMAKMGIYPWRWYPYYRALEDGWAPMPTNIYQRAAYERWNKYKDANGKVPLGAPIVNPDK